MSAFEKNFLFDIVSRKNLKLIWAFHVGLYFGWFSYIFGVLGHVCPVAFLGMWHASLLGCIAFRGQRPRFLGTFIALLWTIICWGIAYFLFHPVDFDKLSVVINVEPFMILIINAIGAVLIQILSSKRSQKKSRRFELILERILAVCVFLICIIIGFGYIIIPDVKEAVWNDEPNEWFDTIFGIGDVWRLFLFLAIISSFSGLCMGISFLFKETSEKQRINKILFHILGYSFMGFLILGTWGLFVYLGTPKIDTAKLN